MKKSLVIFHMSHQYDWDEGIVNRNYHVYSALLKSGQFDTILSIDFLPFTRKKKLKAVLKNKFLIKGPQTVYKSPKTVVNRVENTVFHMVSLDADDLAQALQAVEIDLGEAVFWSYNPFVSTILEEFEDPFVVFDAVDNWMEHPAYTDFVKTLEGHYDRIRKRADMIFTVSEGLIDFFGKKEHVLYIPNGVDAAHFEAGDSSKLKEQYFPKSLKEKRASQKTTIIGYHGVIQSRVNTGIIQHIANQKPEWDILIAGPVWKEMKKEIDALAALPNVHFAGPVPYMQLPHFIQLFDAAIIPHRVDRFTNSMNPLKMYEYLAAGKPIVSTAIAGADYFHDEIHLAVSPQEFVDGLEKVLHEDKPELHERRQRAVSVHSWKQRVGVMLNSIERGIQEKEAKKEGK